MPSFIKRIISLLICITLLISLVGCSNSDNASSPTPTSYVNDNGNLVVDGVEIKDSFVKLQLDQLVVQEAEVLDLKVEDVIVNCVVVDKIEVLEAEVVSLSDDFIYLAYQNFVSCYEEDIDWGQFLKDVAIGSTCIIVCVTLSTVGGPVGTFFGAVICSEFTASALVIGAAIDAAVSGYMAYQEGGDASYIIGHMINGVADGFKWAAILAPITGAASGIKALRAVSALRKVPGMEQLSDKALNEVLKNFEKIAKKTAKEASNASDDVLKALFKEMGKELPSEITEDIFISTFRNSNDIVRIITKYNPFGVASGVTKTFRQEFIKKADNISDSAANEFIKKLQNKSIKKLQDISDKSLREYVEKNMAEFIELFGSMISKDLLDDCLLSVVGEKTFKAIKSVIADNGNSYAKLIAEIGKETTDNLLNNVDAVILLETRYGAKNINHLVQLKRLYNYIDLSDSVDASDIEKVLNGLLDGTIKSIDDVTKINKSAGINVYKSSDIICEALKKIDVGSKANKFLDDVAANRIDKVVNIENLPVEAIDSLIADKLTKKQIIEKFGESAYKELVNNADQVILALGKQAKINNKLAEELLQDALSAKGLSDDVIKKIVAGTSIFEWGLDEKTLINVGNQIADYYKVTDATTSYNFNRQFAEIRGAVADEFNRANNYTVRNYRYAGKVMTPNESIRGIKAKYGDVYMSKAGYPIFDDYAIARIEIANLTGDEDADIALANLLHHGTQANIPGYTWHHLEDGKTMILVPTDLHEAYRHDGGAKLLRDGAFGAR